MKRLSAIALTGMLSIGAGTMATGSAAEQKGEEKVGDSRSCLSNSAIVSRIVEDERTIRFETLGGRVYRNRLSAPCPGLRQAASGFGSVAFEVQGTTCAGAT